MKPIKSFGDFIREGVVRKQTSDIPRARFLIREVEKSYRFVDRVVGDMGIDDGNANAVVKLCYDIITEIIRAKMLLEGFNASGQGAHEAEVSYMREIGLNENSVQFANQLRYFRNGMLYYGKILDMEYAEKVMQFTKDMYPKLMKLIPSNVR